MRLPLPAAATLAAGLAACTSVGSDGAPVAGRTTPNSPTGSAIVADQTMSCFYPEQVQAFRFVDRQTVNLRLITDRTIQVQLATRCLDPGQVRQVNLRQRQGRQQACGPLDVDLVVGGPLGPQTCSVRDIREFSPAARAALPDNQQP